jgi:hypothetical protein
MILQGMSESSKYPRLAWLGVIAIGMVIGITMGVVLEAKFH